MAIQVPTVKVYYGTPMLPDVSRVLACLCEKDVKFDLVDMYQGQQMNPNLIKFQVSKLKHIIFLPATAEHAYEFVDDIFLNFSTRHHKLKYWALKMETHGFSVCNYLSSLSTPLWFIGLHLHTHSIVHELEYSCQFSNRHMQSVRLLGRDLLERASIEQWIKSEENSFDPPSYALIFNLAFGFEPDRTIIPESERRLSKVLDVYEQRLGESKFLAGDEFSLADLSHLPNSHYLSKSDKWGHLFDSRKNVKNWCNEMSSRNSWQEVVKILNDYGIGGKKVKVNSEDDYQFLMNKKLNLHLPKDDSNMITTDRSMSSSKEEKTTDKSIDGKNITNTHSATQNSDSDIVSRGEKAQTYDQTLAKDKRSDAPYNSEQNNKSEKEEKTGQKSDSDDPTGKQKFNQATQSGLPGSSPSKQTQEKADNDAKNSQKGKDQASDMELREKEEKDVQSKVKKDDQSSKKPPISGSEKNKDTDIPGSPKEVATKPPASIQNDNSDTVKQDKDDKIMDRTDKELPTKSPTEKENKKAGEVDPNLKSKENQDQNGKKENAQSRPQGKTPDVPNQKENKKSDISGDEDTNSKNNSQKTDKPKPNGDNKVTAPVSNEKEDQNGPKEESREIPKEAQSRPQEKTPDMSNPKGNKNREISGGEEVESKDISQKDVPKNNGKSVSEENPSKGQKNANETTPTESQEKLQDDKSSQKKRTGNWPGQG